ncbi:MAG TPA: ATP-binding protein [Chthoniobacteraceae bacterium]|nr:ATP-binding protein [Chthoniobacteraceae bacterium]
MKPGLKDRLLGSLRLKVISIFLALALIPFGLMTFLNYRTTSSSLKEAIRHSLQASGSETALTLDAFISAKLTAIDTESKLPILSHYLQTDGAESATQVLNSLRSLNGQDPIFIFSSALLDAMGRNVADTWGQNVGRDESKLPHFVHAMESGLPYVSPVIFGRTHPMIAFSAPVRTDDGKIVGVLRTFYDAHVLQQLVVGTTGLAGHRSFAILLDENQLILAYGGHTQQEAVRTLFHLAAPLPVAKQEALIRERRLPPAPEQLVGDPFVDKAVRGGKFGKGDVASASVTLRHQPWRVVFVTPASAFLQPLRMQALRTMVFLLVTTGVVVFIALWNARILFHPLRQLNEMANRVASGHLDAKVPVLSRDEIGQLAQTFNWMTEQLRERQQERDLLLSREKAARAEAEEANRLKDDFLATLSHELRTPLTAILGWVNLLKNEPGPEELREGLAIVERNAWAETQLVDDLLDVSRITRGKITLNRDALDLGMIIDEAVEAITPSLHEKEVTLSLDLPGESVCTVGDWHRLRQIILNLLGNAVKFTTAREGRILLKLREKEGRAVITVADNGIGISREHLPNIFTRFMQVDSSSTRRYGGMGLGLPIAKHLVELHGGTLEVESEGEGKGATFTVKLPLIPLETLSSGGAATPGIPPAPPLPSTAAPSRKGGALLDGLRILIVEDDNDTLEMLRRILSEAGAEVITAQSVEAGLEQFKAHHPDVLLSDIGLPQEDGCTLLKKIRREPGAGATIPAAALTAFVAPEDYERTTAAGFTLHLPKPIEPTRLAAAVAELARRGEQE